MKCLNCGRAVRQPGTSAAEHPGTVAIAAKGLCGACYRRQRLGAGTLAAGDTKPAEVHYLQSPCVLVRVDLTPATYKALNAAHIDINALLSNYAGSVAAGLSERAS